MTADGLRLEVAGDRQTCTYWAGVYAGDFWVTSAPSIYYTEAEARRGGEETLCRVRASRELAAMGESEAAAEVHRLPWS